ncbi:hypothetical protein K7432_015612 [Basidiobolus ranarum]|uniref:RlpA-like protein double-psi beta-barrel domain-containing protein n=1 Tax=Basidiobolus ranarum TaxID=34480 RepID=A0ABR2WFV7_9FUNG
MISLKSFSTISILAILFAAQTSAAPMKGEAGIHFSKRSSFSGDGTYYTPGLGACGVVNGPTELIAALNAPQFGPYANPSHSPACYSCALVNGPLGSVKVKIVDKCPTCKFGSLDLSPAAFNHIALEAQGRVHITWTYVACDGAPEEQQAAVEVHKNVKPTVESKKPVEPKPTVEVKKSVEAKPTVEVKKSVEAKPTVEVKKSVEVKPTVSVKKSVEAKPTVSVKKSVEAKPTVKAVPTTSSTTSVVHTSTSTSTSSVVRTQTSSTATSVPVMPTMSAEPEVCNFIRQCVNPGIAQEYETCTNGQVVMQSCASGTVCENLFGDIICTWA